MSDENLASARLMDHLTSWPPAARDLLREVKAAVLTTAVTDPMRGFDELPQYEQLLSIIWRLESALYEECGAAVRAELEAERLADILDGRDGDAYDRLTLDGE